MTASQERALAELWPVHGLEFAGSEIDFDALFGRSVASLGDLDGVGLGLGLGGRQG